MRGVSRPEGGRTGEGAGPGNPGGRDRRTNRTASPGKPRQDGTAGAFPIRNGRKPRVPDRARCLSSRLPPACRRDSGPRQPTTCRAASSASVSDTSMIRSTPEAPRMIGTPTTRPSILYSPRSSTAQGSTRFRSFRIEIDHVQHRRSGSVEGAAGLEQSHDLRAAVAGPLHQRLDPIGLHQLRQRDPRDGRVSRHRNHRVAVAAQHEGRDVRRGDAQVLGDEGPEAGAVQDARHADDALAREAARLQGDVDHRIERVGDDDQDRVRRVLGRLPDHVPDDGGVLEKQVVASLPGWRAIPAVTTMTSDSVVSA